MKVQKGKYLKSAVKPKGSILLICLAVLTIFLSTSVCLTAVAIEFRDGFPAPQEPVNEKRMDRVVSTEAAAVNETDAVFVAATEEDVTESLETTSASRSMDSPIETPADDPVADVFEAEATEPSYVLEASPESRYYGVNLTQEDLDLLIDIVWLEARGEPFRGQRAVAEVVFNRMVSEEFFPDTLYEVIYDDEIAVQFPTVYSLDMANPTDPQYKLLTNAIEQALNGPHVLPMNVVFFGAVPENDNIWGTIEGHTFCYPWTWD